MDFLVDENMPRSLAPEIAALGHTVQDVRDVGLRGRPDEEVFATAVAAKAIIITRDQGFKVVKRWPREFTAGVIAVELPDDTPVSAINAKIVHLLRHRLPQSLQGALTVVERRRALSRIVRRHKAK